MLIKLSDKLQTSITIDQKLIQAINLGVGLYESNPIEDNEQLEYCAGFKKKIDAILKDAEKARKKIKQPYYDAGKQIDTVFKEVLADLKEIGLDVKNRINTYVTAEQKKAHAAKLESERIEKEKQEKEAALNPVTPFDEIDDNEEQFVIDFNMDNAVENINHNLPDKPASDHFSTSEYIEPEIVELGNVPRNLLMVDDKKLKEFIKNNKALLLEQCNKSPDQEFYYKGILFKLKTKTRNKR